MADMIVEGPYDSFRFEDPSDHDQVIYQNLASLGSAFEQAWKRILLADALFANTDRHMRNFGVIRSSLTGETLRLAPNFDNNQACLTNPGGTYFDAMLNLYMKHADSQDIANLRELIEELKSHPCLKQAYEAKKTYVE